MRLFRKLVPLFRLREIACAGSLAASSAYSQGGRLLVGNVEFMWSGAARCRGVQERHLRARQCEQVAARVPRRVLGGFRCLSIEFARLSPASCAA